MHKKAFLYFGSILGMISFGSPDTGWKLIKEKAETKIYTRENEGEQIKELKIISKLDATVAELVSVYMDVENHPNWYPACVAAKIIKKVSESHFQVYHRMANPWPIKDRDYVIEVKSTQDGETGGVLIEYKDVKGQLSEASNCVRMKKIQGYWKFASSGNGKTLVTYVFNFDPGGSTPVIFINSSLSRIGINLFAALSEHARSRRAASTH